MADMTEIKRVKNAILFHDKAQQPLIRVDGVRLSYAFLGHPSEDENDDGVKSKRWRSNFLLPKETHSAAKALIEEVIQGLIKANDAKVPKDKWFLNDGDDKEDEYSTGSSLLLTARFAQRRVTERVRSWTTSTRSTSSSTRAHGRTR